jgi:anti-anti-sigma regulatory factor
MRDVQPSPRTAAPTAASPARRYGEVRVVMHDAEGVVSLHGDIDVGVAGEFDAAAHELARADLPVHMDASRVTFCDSAAVHFLALLLRSGLSVRVSDADDRLATLLALAKAPATLITAVRSSTPWATSHRTDTSVAAADAAESGGEPPQQELAARLARLRREHRAAERARGSLPRN